MNFAWVTVVAIAAAALGMSACSRGSADAAPMQFTEAVLEGASPGLADYIAVHRSLNPATGEHFYTASPREAAQPGLQVEAFDYFYLARAPGDGWTPFYRCRKGNGKHFYTVSEACESSGAVNEGSLGFIATAPAPDLTPLYRLYDHGRGNHLYTVRAAEQAQAVIQQGYVEEGIAGYVWVPPLYIAPIAETLDAAVIEDMKNSLAPAGSGPNVILGWSRSTWYLGEIRGASGDYAYDPTRLRRGFEIATALELPLVINMNGGRWSGRSALTEHLLASVSPYGTTLAALDQHGNSMFSADFGRQYFSLSRLNRLYQQYKKRNLQAAAAEVAAFHAEHPDLFIGVSLDSETMLADPSNPWLYGDYNPMAIEEWRQWLSGTGIYDPADGEYAGQARSPPFASIAEFNAAMGTSFSSWSELQPPRAPGGNHRLWLAWRRWGIRMVEHHTQDMADWIASQGIPMRSIFNHQTPGLDPLLFGDDLSTAVLFGGTTVGITTLGSTASDANLIRRVRGLGRHVGTFEWNPLTSAPAQYQALRLAYLNTFRVVAPYFWPIEVNFPHLSIKGRPTEVALRDFIRDYGSADQ